MKLSITFKKRLFLTITIVFAIFLVASLFIEQYKEQTLKRDALVEQLEIYSDIVDKSIQHSDSINMNIISPLLPTKLRLSILDINGDVIYDNSINKYSLLPNHSDRPEIQKTSVDGKSYDIRTSESNQQKYIYFAKKYRDFYIRTALPYDIDTIQFLKPDNFFIYVSLILFIIVLIVVNYVSQRLSASINSLVDIVINSDSRIIKDSNFKETELNQITDRLIEYFNKLKESKRQIQIEKEKLLQHIQTSQEGICFFSDKHEVLFFNGLFMQYMNLFFDGNAIDPNYIIKDNYIEGLKDFISKKDSSSGYFETRTSVHGRYFSVRASIFTDGAYEIVINDITKQEKMRLLKQEMTGNISHELRTPITSIRGYLETVLSQNLTDEKKIYFLQKAEKQTLHLSELINDMSLLTKIDDNPAGFNFESISFDHLLSTIAPEYTEAIKQNEDTISWHFPKEAIIRGNRNLLSSIFKNLIENTLRYAGNKVEINISLYNEDQYYYYISYYDTGIGVSHPEHLSRLFERFYRVQEGRTRETGGSGLGLAIVKNAVTLHKGTIVAKQHNGGGLEFLIKLKK